MEVEVRVSLINLKRAFRRLLARLPDESEAGSDFIVFSASGNRLDIVVGGTSEVLSATVGASRPRTSSVSSLSWHRPNATVPLRNLQNYKASSRFLNCRDGFRFCS
jgi:hypothetical protein